MMWTTTRGCLNYGSYFVLFGLLEPVWMKTVGRKWTLLSENWKDSSQPRFFIYALLTVTKISVYFCVIHVCVYMYVSACYSRAQIALY